MARTINRRMLAGLIAATCAAAALPAAAETTMKIYSARMPDGSLMLSDRPPAGTKDYSTSTYAVPDPKQRDAVAAEREYWRRQAEAFERRQMLRDAAPRGGRQWSTGDFGPAPVMEPVAYGPYGYIAQPVVPITRVPRVYESSPGAVRGRSSGFIGSGFSTAR